MPECKPSEKSPNGKPDLTSITTILNTLLGVFGAFEKPGQGIPPAILLLGKNLRPGMSPRNMSARITSRVDAEAGIPMGDVFADGPNNEEAMELIRVEEILNSLLTESVVNVAIPPGISVTTVGVGNLGAPVVAQGFTTTIASGNGIIR